MTDSVDGLPASYIDAAAAIECSFIRGSGTVIFSGEVVDIDDFENIFPYKELESLRAYLYIGDTEAVRGLLTHILDYAKSLNMSLHLGRYFCFELTNQVLRLAREANARFSARLPVNDSAIQLTAYGTIDEMIDSMQKLMTDLCNVIKDERAADESRQIDAIRDYVRANACDPAFSLQATATHFDLTLTSLCQYFKADTGKTVMEFATEVRMERATELLLNSSLTVQEISEKLGYSTASSFIRRFKQIVGVTPREFAKKTD